MSRLARSLILFPAVLIVGCSAATNQSMDANMIAELRSNDVHETRHYGYGNEATEREVAGWNIDVRPDGLGLPPGSATAEDGEMLYEDKCASCHGSFGEGVGRYPVLAGGEGTLSEPRPEKTVGSFWPYASTLWDYIHRAMPFAEPESLMDEEVYAITAYVLYLNDLIEYDFEVTQANLANIDMPNKDGFFVDDRPDVLAKPCMHNCKDPNSVQITSEPQIVAAGEVDDSSTVVKAATPGKAVYDQACAICHDAGVGEAPIPGDTVAWESRLVAGRDALVENAIQGLGIMPPKGGQLQLSDEEVAAAVDFIVSVAPK